MRRFFRRGEWDRERAREIQAHLDHHVDDLVARGSTREDATRIARIEFGNPTLVREDIYAMNSIPPLETLTRDLRYAARMLRKSPGFSLAAVLTLALALAINTAVFSIVDGVLLRPLPVPDPDRLGLVETRLQADGTVRRSTAQHGTTWVTLRDHATTVTPAVFSTWVSGANLLAGTRAVYADQQKVGAGFFGVLGVRPLHGREFSADEDRRGGPGAVLLAHEFWRAALGGDLSVLGTTITLRGAPHTVVGILPEAAQLGARADLWTPLRASTDGEGAGENYHVLLRLRPGRTWAQAEAELQALGREIDRLHPPAGGTSTGYGWVPLQQGLTAALRRPLMLLWTAVGAILLIACVNLAGLLFARGARRRHEIATRLALGSSRWAIVRQLLVESALLALAGAVGGLVLGGLTLRALETLAADAFNLWQPVALDGRSAVAAALLAAGAMLAFGVLPALHSTRAASRGRLSSGAVRAVAGGGSRLAGHVTIVTQVALGMILLVGAGLLLRTFTHLRGLEPGFDGTNVYAATVSLQDARFQTSAQVNALADTVLRRVQASAGIEGAAVSLGLPYQRLLNLGFRHMDGTDPSGPARMTSATYIAGDYFSTLRIPVRAGRVFDARETATSAPVVVVNETIARDYFGGTDPVGRRIGLAGAEREIVGVVGDVQVRPGFGDRGPIAPMPLAYIPLAQANDAFLRLVHGWFPTGLIVRGPARMEDAMAAVRAAVDPSLPFAAVQSMSDVQRAALAQPRLLMVLLVVLAAAAVLLAALGLHALIAASVNERTREMGIRLALGETTTGAVRAAAKPGILLALVGVGVGTVAARTAVSLLRTFVWGVSPTDPATFAAVAVLFLVVASVASILPALRILRLDPAQTLRSE